MTTEQWTITNPVQDKKASYNEAYHSVSANPLTTPVELADRYCFEEEHGHGAQGQVFLARRLSDNVRVAIKRLRIDSVSTWKEYTLFRREADVLASLNIPGVVRLYEACEYINAVPPCSYIVQEYLDGMTMQKFVESGMRMTIAQVCDVVCQLLTILYQLHHHDPVVIHRDIKPSNIMLIRENANYRVYLLDFGAVSNPQLQGGGSTVAGTFGYMPPEQIAGHPTPASDIYALACTCVYMLSGKEPADIPTADFHLIIDPVIESAPVSLVQTLRQMLAPSEAERLVDYNDLICRFDAFRHEQFSETLDSCASLGFGTNTYLQKLKAVDALNVPGNFELWQALPEQTPREFSFNINDIYVCKLRPECESLYVVQDNAFTNFISPVLAISGFMLGALVAFWVIDNKFLPSFLEAILFLVLPLGCTFGVVHILSKTNILNRIFGRNKKVRTFECNKMVDASRVRRNLLINGRKTVATVVAMDYIPTKQDYMSILDEVAIVRDPPSFVIRYKFNPPDDASPDDLYHSIIVHRDPETTIQIGDPLPILYCMDESGKNVTSMPFPYPIMDNEMPDDYIYSRG